MRSTSFILLASLSGASAAWPFQRFMQTTNSGSTTAAAPKSMVIPTATIDATKVDEVLKTIDSLVSGDLFGVMTAMVAQDDLAKALSDPDILYQVLDTHTYLSKALIGFDKLKRKRRNLSAADGLTAVDVFKNMAAATVKSTELLTQPSALSQLFSRWGNPADKETQGLFEQLASGDGSSALELSQKIMDSEFGSIVDLKNYGYDGHEPDVLKQLRTMLVSDEDSPLSLAYEDDEDDMKDWIVNPMQAVKDAVGLAGVEFPPKPKAVRA